MTQDLSAEAVAQALPGRAIRAYPALLSTEADAMAWARTGAPEGAVVVAGYQASPRGRSGLPWEVEPDRSLVFSVVLRPTFPPAREGWLYTVAVSAVADVLGPGAEIEWPDEVHLGGRRRGAVGVQVEAGPSRLEWGVVSLLVAEAPPPRSPLLARVVESLERRYRSSAERVVADYTGRCCTLGRRVRARLIPLGPGGPEVIGTAVSTVIDGSLVLDTAEGRRVAVPPQNLGMLEDAPDEERPAEG